MWGIYALLVGGILNEVLVWGIKMIYAAVMEDYFCQVAVVL